MKFKPRHRFPAWCLVLLAACAIPASAQWTTTGSACNSCQTPSPLVTSVPMPAPVYRAMAPVQTTVQTPVAYTQYVNQPVTQMVPVTRQQTRQIPSVQYRTVTQYQTRNRDMGRWVTRYTPNRRLSPCQVDPRPGFGGWLNRTGYEMRNMFTPQYSTRREYVPNVVAQTVPVTRRVAVPSTRTVAYNVTQMVPRTVNRQVAVSGVRYVTQNYTTPSVAMQPSGYAPSVAWAPSTVNSGAVAWDPFGGSLAAAPVVASTPYDQMAVMTEDQFEQRVALDDKMQPVPDRDVPRSARREDRDGRLDRDDLDENLFSDDDDDRLPVRSRRPRDYEPQKRTSAKTDLPVKKSSFSSPPPASRFQNDGFFNDTPPATRQSPPPAAHRAASTRRAPAHAEPSRGAPAHHEPARDDTFFDETIPEFDQGGGGGAGAFDDMGFEDEGVQFDEPSASRYQQQRPTAMRRQSTNSRVARNDGWNASRATTRLHSRRDDNNTNTILVSNELP